MSAARASRSRVSELDELKKELADKKNDKKIDAIKRILGMLNVGKDVSGLFFPVMKCLEVDSIEIRKLVYLYIIFYSKDKPADSIMAINNLVKDTSNKSNPLIRALAVRTMGCLRVPDLCEYLIQPLGFALEDKDAFVRKNAVMCLAKVYELDPKLVEKHNLIQKLKNILEKDKNPTVIANTVIALSEINTMRPLKIKVLTKNNLDNVLAALNETNEWGQVCMLDYLALNPPKESKNAEVILDRVLPRLSHINSAVVLSACKVIISYFPLMERDVVVEGLCKKLAAPLGTLVSGSSYENTWVVLRGLQLVVKKYPQIFSDVKIFFIRYNDPSYVKHEKLNMIYSLSNERNYEIVLNELNEYAYDMDPEFTRATVRCIWKMAVKISVSLSRILGILASIVNNVSEGSGQHFIEEVSIGYEQIIRKYPKASNYSDNVKQIFSKNEALNKPEAKVSQLFLLGEFYNHIEDGHSMITDYITTMQEEDLNVQLQILNTAVKIYVNHPDNFLEQLSTLFKTASENTDNPDLRDRAFIYWRLLNLNDLDLAKEIISGERPQIEDAVDDSVPVEPELASKLISQIGMISSVMWQSEEALGLDIIEFMPEDLDLQVDEKDQTNTVKENDKRKEREKKKEDMEQREIDQEDLLGLGMGGPDDASTPVQKTISESKGDAFEDLLGIGINDESPNPSTSQQTQFGFGGQVHQQGNPLGGFMDLGGVSGISGGQQQSTRLKQPLLEIVLPRMQSGMSGKNGIEIMGCVLRSGSGLNLQLNFKTMVPSIVSVNYINIMQNSLGITGNYQRGACIIPANGAQDLNMPMTFQTQGGHYTSMLNMQISTSYDEYMLSVPVYPHIFGNSSRPVTSEEFKQGWVSGQTITVDQPVIPPVLNNEEQLKQLLRDNGITHLSTQFPGAGKKYYFGTRLDTSETAYIEISVPSPAMIGGYQVVAKSPASALVKPIVHSIIYLLK